MTELRERAVRLTHAARAQPCITGAASMFVLLLLVYSFSIGLRATRGASITGDEPFYLLTTQSLIDDGNLDLRLQYETASYRSFFDHPNGLWKQSVPMADGTLLSPHEPGLSVLVIPGFLVGGLRGVQVQLMVLAALTMSLAFVLSASETGRPLLSWLVTGAVALSATAFVYATEIYPEFPAALCLVLGLLLARRPGGGTVAAVTLAVLMSACAWLGIKYVPLACVVALLFLARATRRGQVTLLALGVASGAVYVWFHYAVFGSMTAYSVNTVYEGAPTTDVLQSHLAFGERAYRLWGLFIDRRFGIGRWTPLFLLVVPALPLLARRGWLCLSVCVLIVVQMVIATFVAITMMGWWFPGRMLVVVLPLFALVLTVLVERLSRGMRLGVAVLGAYSALVTLLLYRTADHGAVVLAVDPFEMAAWPFRALGGLFPDYRTWSTGTVTRTCVWLVLAVIAAHAIGAVGPTIRTIAAKFHAHPPAD